MNLTEHYLTKNRCYTKAIPIKVKGLMLHSVGCSQPDPMVFCRSWDNATASKCVHAFISGNNGEVVQTLPWVVKGWHCGASGNSSHIGVEMCESNAIKYSGNTITMLDREKALASAQRTYQAAVELFAMLCKRFGLDPMTDICSHAEGYRKGIASNHGDPEHYWAALGTGYTMDGFRKDVKEAMAAAAATNAKAKEVFTMKTLRKGDKGIQVKVLQYVLQENGCDCGKVDGEFGKNTEKALRQYQADHALTADSICGAKTWAKLLG